MNTYDNQRRRQREIPPTTAWRVIFTFDKKPKKYDRDSYSPQLTDGRASTQEIDQVLSQIEAIKNPIDSKLLISTLVMCGMVFFFFVVVSYLCVIEDKNFIVAPALCAMITLLVGLFRIMYLQNKFKDDCEEALKNDINRKFASRGLKWKIEKEWPHWVELHNDWRLHGGSKKQQTAQQPEISNQNAGGQLHLQIYQGEPQNNTNLYTPYVPPPQH